MWKLSSIKMDGINNKYVQNFGGTAGPTYGCNYEIVTNNYKTMKRIIITMLVVGISLAGFTQQTEDFFQSLTKKYENNDGFSASMLTSDMFDLYLRKKNVEESSEVSLALKKLDNILVVSQSKYGVHFFPEKDEDKTSEDEKTQLDEVYKEIQKHYPSEGYALLKTEKRMGEEVKVYLKKKDGKVLSLALITNSSASTNLVELNGDIDLANVASLSRAMNLKGLDNLYKIDDNSPYSLFPAYRLQEFDEQRMAEMQNRVREVTERRARLSEEQIAKIEKQAQMQAQKQMEMAEKYREMAEMYGRHPIFLSAPGDTNTVYYINGKNIDAKDVKSKLENEDIKTITRKYDEKKGVTEIKISTR